MKKISLLLVMLLLLSTVACGATEENPNNATPPVEAGDDAQVTPSAEERGDGPEVSAEESTQATDTAETMPEPVKVYADLSQDYNALKDSYEIANGWSNGSMFNCTWRKKNCTFEDGVMKLTIDLDGQGNGAIPYSGGEFRSREFYGYGYYEVCMKPIKNDGVVSSFFTYTGPSDNNPWDEIDIEFLGKDTTKVQFNYFTNGKGNHEKVVSLGFDAAEDFHTYAFLWEENAITWYVDGVEVHKASLNIPKTPSKIMMNVWPGTGVDGWLNAFDGTTPISAEYKYFLYDENGKPAE